MKKKFLLSSIFLFAFIVQGFAAPLKVGFVYVGPVSDHGWTYQHNEGKKVIEKHFGDKIKINVVESVSEGADAIRVIRQLANSKHELIFTTSFGYMNPTITVAKQYSKVKFEHATGYKRSKNVSTYNARFYEGRYPVGLIAGSVTKSNVIGYIASFPIPEVVRGINAVAVAARKINPKAEVRVIWVNTWYDPGKEADAAKTLIGQGADVILQHTDSPAALQVAEKQGVWAVGQASDMSAFAPKAHLTAIINNWGPYYVNRVEAVLNGTWTSIDTWDGLKEGAVKLAPFNSAIPNSVQKLATQAVEDIKSGKLHPFQGPIKTQDGKILVAAGKHASDGELLKMSVFVEGVQGQIPQ